MRTRTLRAIALLLAILVGLDTLTVLDALRLSPVPTERVAMPWSTIR